MEKKSDAALGRTFLGRAGGMDEMMQGIVTFAYCGDCGPDQNGTKKRVLQPVEDKPFVLGIVTDCFIHHYILSVSCGLDIIDSELKNMQK